MKKQKDSAVRMFNVMAYTILTLISLVCLIPFWLIVSGSLSSEASVLEEGFGLIPRDFTLEAYRVLLSSWEQILSAYTVTIGVTLAGTVIGLYIVSMAAYVLRRSDFKYRNIFAFMMYFTTLFSGGLIPWYILMVKYLNLKDSYLALIIPPLVSAWNIFLMRNFMKSIPDSVIESAKIDGATEFTIYSRIILPLSKPALATIGLFMALGYWNDWFLANLFITTKEKFPLQYFLYKVLSYSEFLNTAASKGITTAAYEAPSETLKLATAVIVTGPIIFLYPFVQKYFVKGITLGSVKE